MGFRNPITTAIDPTARDLANEALTQIIPGSRLAADAIDGRTITGATVQTAKSGLRWVMSGLPGDADRLLGYTGTTAEQAPGQLQVGFAPGDTSSNSDRGFVSLAPPIVGSGYIAGRPGITAYGQTRDATDPGFWEIDGAVQFTGQVTLPEVYAYLFTAVNDAYASGWQDVYFRSEGPQQGGGFTAPGYRFTVPVAADYEIGGQATFVSLPANTYHGARISVNSVPIVGSGSLRSAPSVTADCTARTPTVIVTCAKGATIGLQAYCGVNYSSRGNGVGDGISPSLTIRKL